MAEVADAHRRAEFIHLRIRTNGIDDFFRLDTKILQVIQPLANHRVLEDRRSAFDCMEDFRCVEAENRRITKRCNADTLLFLPEGMRRIVNHAQAMFFRDGLDTLDVADVAIDMHGHDGRRLWCNQRFNQVWVDGEVAFADIAENRLQPIPNNRVRRRGKRERRRDNFAAQVERLQRQLECHVAIHEQG